MDFPGGFSYANLSNNLLPAMLAKKSLGHRKHGASDVPCKILHLLPERVEDEGLGDMLDKVSLLMVP